MYALARVKVRNVKGLVDSVNFEFNTLLEIAVSTKVAQIGSRG